MPLFHTRQLCRSHNPFSPSVVLWQHFVLPHVSIRSYQQALPKVPSGPGPSDAATHVSAKRSGKPHHGKEKPWVDPAIKAASASKIETLDPRAEALAALRNSTDYTGRVIESTGGVGTRPPEELPWVELSSEGDSWERLDSEIRRFSAYARPSPAEAVVRRNLVEEIVDHIQAVVPKAETEVFGSQCTGLALALSDIDIRLVLPALPELSKKRRVERDMRALNKLRKALSKLPRTYSNVAMFHSQFPLISLNQVPTGVQLQIVLAKRDVSRDGKAVAKYMEEYPYLVDLYTVIKTMLAVRGLSDVFMGSIGAYPLFMMIVASLRHNRPTRQDAAGGLVSFLRFWAEFDTSKGLSIEPTELFDKRANIVGTEKYKSLLREGSTSPLPTWMLCLRDPANPTNDLGRKGASIKHVQATCRHLAEELGKALSQPSVPATFLTPIVGPIYDVDFLHRQKLLENQLIHQALSQTESCSRRIEGWKKKIAKILSPGNAKNPRVRQAVVLHKRNSRSLDNLTREMGRILTAAKAPKE